MRTTFARRVVTAATALVLGATMAGGAYAVVQDPPGRTGKLVSFGPLMDNGFPTSYKDSNGLRLEGCLTADDPFCPAATGPTYDGTLPLSFPDNFPDEFFYQLQQAVIPVNAANPTERLLVETNLEGAFGTFDGAPAAGQQMVFGRIRIRDKDVPLGTTWRITHPYGVDELTADAGGINVTMDIGATTGAGAFVEALSSRIGPFLRWDPAVEPQAPAGYIGDPGVLHKVIGSPYNTNYVKVEQKNADGSYTTIGQWDDQFSLTGRLATNSGVNVDAAYFTGDDSGGTLDVYASSDALQAIRVNANATLGTPTVSMHEQNGRYYARLDVDPKIPAGTVIDVQNTGDKPPSVKHFTIQDQVAVTAATYNADTGDLTVTATSTDTETGADAPALSVDGFGPLVNGTATFPGVTAPPPFVKVTSTAGGSDTSTLTVSGAGFGAVAPVPQFTLPATVQVGQPVTLSGAASTGDIATYAWSTTNGAVAPATGVTTTWTPATATPGGTASVTLTVTSTTNVTASVTQTVEVLPSNAVTADAGPAQVKTRGSIVTLNGSATGQASVLWTQVNNGAPTVAITGANTLSPTFRFPLMALPVGPIGNLNAGYVPNTNPIVMRLTATAANNTTATSTVTISATPETITPLTARYRTRGDWRLTGTTDLKVAQTVAMVLGSNPAGAYIGQAQVDAAGAFSFKGGRLPVGVGTTVTYVSSTGGVVTGPLLITP